MMTKFCIWFMLYLTIARIAITKNDLYNWMDTSLNKSYNQILIGPLNFWSFTNVSFFKLVSYLIPIREDI